VEGYVQVKTLGRMDIKGLSAPVEVYELASAGLARSRLQAAAARGLTRFVGRDAEVEVLRQTLEQAGAGRGQVVALVGEPGVGKSRLTWEFTHSHRSAGWLVLESGSVSYGKATSYLPLIDLLKSYFQIEGPDDHRRVRQKVLGKVLDLDESLRATLPALLSLFDVPVDDARWQSLDPAQRRHQTLDAVKRLLLRESQAQPLLMVFEDLHWIDAETQALLDTLVESLPGAHLLLLVNYRPEYEHAWGRKTYYRGLRLDPLPPTSAEELLRALLGEDPALAPLTRLLIERTEGNPFFLEESVRTLVETGVLAGERGAHSVAKPLGTSPVPGTVQAVLGARIDRLAPEDKRVLQTAAVIGKDIPYTLLQAIWDGAEAELRERLARLHAAEFVYESSLFPELEYTFKHALTHEVTYGSLLQDRRRTVHAGIVDAMEALYANRQSEQVERLAYHAFRGELWTKAVAYLRQASEKATARSAYREAVGYLEQALVALGHLPTDREMWEQAIDVRFDLRSALFPLGEFERLLAHLRDAEPIAEALGDRRRLGQFYIRKAQIESVAGEPSEAIAAGQRALALAQELDDFAIKVEATYRLGHTYCHLGDYAAASDWLSRCAASLQGDLLHARLGQAIIPSVACRAWLAYCHAERGEFAAGLAAAEEAVSLAEGERPLDLLGVCHFLGLVYLYRGDLEGAAAVYKRSVELCQTWQIRFMFPYAAAGLGYTYALAGQVATGLPLLEEAVEQAVAMHYVSGLPLWTTWLGEGYLLAGRPADAAASADRALAFARAHTAPGYEAWVQRLHAEIAARSDPPDGQRAEERYRLALTLAQELGMHPLAAHCHLGLGTLYGTIGRRDDARAELTTALEMYGRMAMTFWTARAKAALG
jgi:tetratricopeptide (TPR) repeat protein